jgi:hypothetical protein
MLVREEISIDWTNPLSDAMGALDLTISSSDERNGRGYDCSSRGVFIAFLNAISDKIVYPTVNVDHEYGYCYDNSSSTPGMDRPWERMHKDRAKNSLRGYYCPAVDVNVNGNWNGVQRDVIKEAATNVELKPWVPLEQTDVARIVGWLLDVIVICVAPSPAPARSGKSDTQEVTLAVRAASTLRQYLSWIELHLATNQLLVQVLFRWSWWGISRE